MRWLALLLLFGGCGNKTGFLLDVTAHQSAQKGIAKLELVVAQKSWCGRWVEDKGASHTVVGVSGRDLATAPYSFLVEPVQATNIHAPVVPLVLARDANGQLLGEAAFGALDWAVGEVRRYTAAVEILQRGSASDGPRYVDDAGCVCLPGQPWMGTGSQSGCDLDVITSFDRLQDTKECELPQGAPLPRACDGQQYPNETMDRMMPCFASVNGTCRVGTRNCHDANGYAYDAECTLADSDPALPDSKLCDAYLACERTACGELVGCFTQGLQPEMHSCVLRIAFTNDGVMHPCADGDWATTISTAAAACPATMLDGTEQPPFTLGFRDASGTAQAVGSCPLTFAVDKIDASSYDDVPYSFDVRATLADRLIQLHVNVQIGCEGQVPSLICQ
jgi:hypothetical protein